MFKVTIFLFAFIIAFLAAEGFSRIYFSHVQSYKVEMWKYNRNLKIPVADGRGHFHKGSSEAMLMNVLVRTNSSGFRGEEINSEKVSKGIVVLGDSLTLGWGVPEQDTFCQRIAQALETNCINAGVGNYNIEQITENFQTNRLLQNTQSVFYFFYINDAEPIQSEYNSEICIHSLACVLIAQSVQTIASQVRGDNDYVKFYQKFYTDENWDKFKISLDNLISVVGKNRLTVVLLPEFRDIQGRPFQNIHQKITEYLNSQKVQNFDLIDFPKPAVVNEYWVSFDDPHPNAQAHKTIADLIVNRVKF